jgi:hypothetical protein
MSRVQVSSPAPFYLFLHIYYVGFEKKLEVFAELSILAMSMFLAAFFCMKVLFIPDSAIKAIDKIYEVEEQIYQER